MDKFTLKSPDTAGAAVSSAGKALILTENEQLAVPPDESVAVHVTVVVDPVGNKMYYYNGTKVTSDPGLNNGGGGTVPALSGLADTFGLLGRSLFDIDATVTGSLNEFRIYSGALSASTVALDDAPAGVRQPGVDAEDDHASRPPLTHES